MARPRKVLPDTAPQPDRLDLHARLTSGGLKAVIGTVCHLNLSDYHHALTEEEFGGVVTIEVSITGVDLAPGGRCGGPEFIVIPVSGQGQFSVPAKNLRMTREEFVTEYRRRQEREAWDTIVKRMDNAKSLYQERRELAAFIEAYVPDGFKNEELAAEIEDLGGSLEKIGSFRIGKIKTLAKRLGQPKAAPTVRLNDDGEPVEEDEDDDRGCC